MFGKLKAYTMPIMSTTLLQNIEHYRNAHWFFHFDSVISFSNVEEKKIENGEPRTELSHEFCSAATYFTLPMNGKKSNGNRKETKRNEENIRHSEIWKHFFLHHIFPSKFRCISNSNRVSFFSKCILLKSKAFFLSQFVFFLFIKFAPLSWGVWCMYLYTST